MNLYELIQQIPNFIQETVIKGRERKDMIGRFHLGLNYDMLLWLSNSFCRVFPCQQEQEVLVKIKNKEGQIKKQERKTMIDIYLVITENVLIMLKTDSKIKNVAKLLAWASLPAIERINHSLTANDQI
jgi:hypothetical protein